MKQLDNQQILAEIEIIRKSLTTVRAPGESLQDYTKREELQRVAIAGAGLNLLYNFLCNLNDIAYEANSRLPR